MERCALCGCAIHRDGDYAQPTLKGRSHATKHHFIPERFFGRTANRPGEIREPIFANCPWDVEGLTEVFCYECHEEVLHNPVILPRDLELLRELVKLRGLAEDQKTESREKLAYRIALLHEVIEVGIQQLLTMERSHK